MNKEVKEIIDRLKDSVENPTILVPTFDGTDEEPIDNDQCLTPSDCKLLLDYINQLETNWNELKKNLEKTKSVFCDIGGTRWNTYNKVLTYMEELENNVERGKGGSNE